MTIQRPLQLQMLEALSGMYPKGLSEASLLINVAANRLGDPEKGDLLANLYYLREHGMLEIHDGQRIGEPPSIFITAKGLDFLADDGGLTAIHSVMTIKLHDDTIKRLVEARVLASDLPAAEKQTLIEKLKSLPAKGMEHLALKLVEKGIDASPKALELVKGVIESWPG